MQKQRQPMPRGPVPEESVGLRDRILWLCPLIGLIAGATLLWLFGVNLWTAVVVVFLIACPLTVIWALASTRRRNGKH